MIHLPKLFGLRYISSYYSFEHGQKLCDILKLSKFSILSVSFFKKKKSPYFVVTKENMLFCLIGYQGHNTEATKILFEWKQSLMVTFNLGQ